MGTKTQYPLWCAQRIYEYSPLSLLLLFCGILFISIVIFTKVRLDWWWSSKSFFTAWECKYNLLNESINWMLLLGSEQKYSSNNHFDYYQVDMFFRTKAICTWKKWNVKKVSIKFVSQSSTKLAKFPLTIIICVWREWADFYARILLLSENNERCLYFKEKREKPPLLIFGW